MVAPEQRPPFPAQERNVGLVSAAAIVGLGVFYLASVLIGVAGRPTADHPALDPLHEFFILITLPCLGMMMMGVYSWAGPGARVYAGVAAALALVAFILWFLRMISGTVVLPWDLFFALSLLAAIPAFRQEGVERWVRRILGVTGTLVLVGVLGMSMGNPQFRNVWFVGYALIFPVAAGLIWLVLWRAEPAPAGPPVSRRA